MEERGRRDMMGGKGDKDKTRVKRGRRGGEKG